MPFKLTILGCNSAVPTIDKNPTAQLLNVNERFFLIDCGEGTQIQLRKYQLSFQRIHHVFISHLHGDHYFGLIGLINSMHLLGRKKELHIYAHIELKDIINLQLKASNTELSFPLFFHPVPTDLEQVIFEDEIVQVRNIILDHSIKCSGFVFREKKYLRKINRKAVEKYNIPFDYYNSLKSGKNFNDGVRDINNKILTFNSSKSHSYAFCSDTIYKPSIISKIRNVDLLYHEATFKMDLKDRAIKTGHSTTVDAANIANKAGVKCLLIGHFSQRYKDLNELKDEAKKIFSNTILASPGLEIDFKQINKN